MKQSKSGTLNRQRKQLSQTQLDNKVNESKNSINKKNLTEKQEQQHDSIPQNVNYYSHFLKHSYITGKDIDFVLKLRTGDDTLKQKLQRIPNQPFNVSDKKIASQETNHTNKDVEFKGKNLQSVEHLMRRRLGPTPSMSNLQFETNLRPESKTEKLRSLERGWSTVPFKQRKQKFPEFLPKLSEEQKLRKQMKETGKKINLTYSGFDGYQNHKPYDYKCKGMKNMGDMTHLLRPDAFMSTIQWQTNLR